MTIGGQIKVGRVTGRTTKAGKYQFRTYTINEIKSENFFLATDGRNSEFLIKVSGDELGIALRSEMAASKNPFVWTLDFSIL